MIAAGLLLIRRLGQVNWGLADQAIVSGCNFATTLLLARALGVEEFGRFTLAWMVVLFAGHLQQALILAPMMSIGPKQDEAAAPAYLASVAVQVVLFILLSSAAIGLAVIVLDRFRADFGAATLLLPLVVASAANQGHSFLRQHFFAAGRPVAALATDSVRYLSQAILLLLATASGADSALALWLLAATALASIAAGGRSVGPMAWNATMLRYTARRHWRSARWLVGAHAAGWLGANAFLLSAGALLGTAAVGSLRAAQVVLGMVQVVYFGVLAVAPAEASRVYLQGGVSGLTTYLRRTATLGGAASCLIILAVLVDPQWWLRLLFGPDYAIDRSIIIGLGLLQILWFVGLPPAIGLRTLERTQPVWRAARLSGLLALALAVPAVALLGIHGVVVGWVASAMLKVSITWREFRKAVALSSAGRPS